MLAAAHLRLQSSPGGRGDVHPQPRFRGPSAGTGGPSAAVFLLDAGHQLLL